MHNLASSANGMSAWICNERNGTREAGTNAQGRKDGWGGRVASGSMRSAKHDDMGNSKKANNLM